MMDLVNLILLVLLAVVGMLVLWLALNWLGLYMRQNFLGKARARELSADFPDEDFQALASNDEVVGLIDFPHVYKQSRWGGLLEIYNLIAGRDEAIEYSAFDLRSSGGSERTASTRSVFVVQSAGSDLISFELGLESFGMAVLWGEDTDIDIENEFVFSKTYHLSGPERERISLLFDSELVGFFKAHMLFFNAGSLTVNNDSLMYGSSQKHDAEGIRESLNVLFKLMALLADKSKQIVTVTL